MHYKNLSIFNIIALAIHIATSYLTQIKAINDTDVGEVSDKYPSLFTPAGLTFSIWGLIYIALSAFCIYHVVCAFRKSADHPANKDTAKIGVLFILNNIATAIWLYAWTHYLLILSAVLIVFQLITLAQMNVRLNMHDASRGIESKGFTQFPLSIYFGWITIATIANISTVLTSYGWNGWGISGMNWTITMIAISVLITVWVLNRRRNVFYGLVVLWGIYGILLKRQDIDPDTYHPIILVCYGAMGIIAVACLFALIRNLRVPKNHGI